MRQGDRVVTGDGATGVVVDVGCGREVVWVRMNGASVDASVVAVVLTTHVGEGVVEETGEAIRLAD
jgi:hypothetical protein